MKMTDEAKEFFELLARAGLIRASKRHQNGEVDWEVTEVGRRLSDISDENLDRWLADHAGADCLKN
jgi:hypothetical protein